MRPNYGIGPRSILGYVSRAPRFREPTVSGGLIQRRCRWLGIGVERWREICGACSVRVVTFDIEDARGWPSPARRDDHEKIIIGHNESLLAGQVHRRFLQAIHVSIEEEAHKDVQSTVEHSRRNESLYGS